MKAIGLTDVIGPIMIGPSSSHTAGALAISAMALKLCAAKPARVKFTLYGSFAHTGRGHGTDKALAAGVLGLAADDERIRGSIALAAERGIDIEFIFDTKTETDHPNTVDVFIVDEAGDELSVRGVSIGGGAAVLTCIDGVDVRITGEHASIVVQQHDARGVLAHIATCAAQMGVNIANATLYRRAKRDIAYTVMEVDGAVPEGLTASIMASQDVLSVRVIPASAGAGEGASSAVPGIDEEVAVAAYSRWDFANGDELLALCEREGLSIADVFRNREEALNDMRGVRFSIDGYLGRVIDVMRKSATEPIRQPEPSTGGLIGGEAQKVAQFCETDRSLLGPIASTMCSYALAVLETNASMGCIVATPTAGSAGVLPAMLFGLQKHRGFADADLERGLLTAAAVGHLLVRNGTVSGAEGGCQAEIGSAAAMAAAAAVEMSGGTPAEALFAASNVIMCLMGLVCDPIAGLVEVPCQKRNATAVATALVCAQIALAGVANLVSFDESVYAMTEVGRSIPFELRESALGGIAAVPSACVFCSNSVMCAANSETDREGFKG